MDYTAKARNIGMAPRKVRVVADGIKHQGVAKALSYLLLMQKRAATPIRKTLESAIANAVNNGKAKKEDLVIKEIQVLGGAVYKRYHFAGRGRIRPYKRRTTHVIITLAERSKKEPEKPAK